ncbi:hypothetical protein B0H19DRAFT_1241108 [Mycena capillaripes]|nr:hypothetical protein B0H19DRAFT_1241108 [Mycena capillaripes]
MRPPQKVSYVDKLATEVWTNCFLYCDSKDLRKLSRVCRYFRELAQPLVFRSQQICAPDRSMLTRRAWRNATRGYRRTAKRLTRLAASPHALAVRRWHVSDAFVTLPTNITNIQILWDTWLSVLRVFKSTLGVYQRLTTLNLHWMTIDEEFRVTLASLPLLEDLTLRTCTLKGALALPLRRLTVLSGHAHAKDAIDIGVPEFLQRLVLDNSPQAAATIAFLAGKALPQLVHIELVLHASDTDNTALLLPLLNGSPRLESSEDLEAAAFPASLPPTAILSLRSFFGSLELVGLFAAGRPVVEATLHSNKFATQPTMDQLGEGLHDLACASVPLECLDLWPEIQASALPVVLGAIHALFPELEELEIQPVDPPAPAAESASDVEGYWTVVPSGVIDNERDERTVELSDDGTLDYASSDSSEDADSDADSGSGSGSDEEASEVAEAKMPGYMYGCSESPAPPSLDYPEPVPTGTDNVVQVQILMRAAAAAEIVLPRSLQVLYLTRRSDWAHPPPFILGDQHRAILTLERLLPALRVVRFSDGGDEWVRDHDVWTYDYARTMGLIEVVSLVWNSDGTRQGIE